MNKTGKGTSIKLGEGSDISPPQGLKITVKGRPVVPSKNAAVDLVFVIDTTGSMSDKIEGLINTCSKFVEEFAAFKLDHRIAIVAFGDLTVEGDRIVATKFTNHVQTTKESLAKIPRYGGGGNEGESSFDALHNAMNRPFRPEAVKVLVLMTDEPALEHGNINANEITRRLCEGEFLTFVFATRNDYYKNIAARTGGKWYEISARGEFSDLLATFEAIAKKVSEVVTDVHRLGNGSVMSYLQLESAD